MEWLEIDEYKRKAVMFIDITKKTQLSIRKNNLKVYARGFLKGEYTNSWQEQNDGDVIHPNHFRFSSTFDKRPRKAILVIVNEALLSSYTYKIESVNTRFVIKETDGTKKTLDITLSFDYKLKGTKDAHLYAIDSANSNTGLEKDFLDEEDKYHVLITDFIQKFEYAVKSILGDTIIEAEELGDKEREIGDKLLSILPENDISKMLDILNMKVEITKTERGLNDSERNKNKEIEGLRNIETEGKFELAKQQNINQVEGKRGFEEITKAKTQAKVNEILQLSTQERLWNFINENPDVVKSILDTLKNNSTTIGTTPNMLIELMDSLRSCSPSQPSNPLKLLDDEINEQETYD